MDGRAGEPETIRAKLRFVVNVAKSALAISFKHKNGDSNRQRSQSFKALFSCNVAVAAFGLFL